MSGKGWIAVDFDGTLAEYHGWNEGIPGEPIKAMQERVLGWLNAGKDVRIFTARVAVTGQRNQVGGLDDQAFADLQRATLEGWCAKHLGRVIPITATKDFNMIELWDDRCVRVVLNKGVPCCDYERTDQ